MNVNRKIDILGRVVIPAEFRSALGLGEGDSVNITCENGVITLSPAKHKCKLCGSTEDILDGTICRNCVETIVSKYSK